MNSASESLLTQCPWCGYSLRGLPCEHRCPECGGIFDRRWKIFRCGGSTEHFALRRWIPVSYNLAFLLCVWLGTKFLWTKFLDRLSWAGIFMPLLYGAASIPVIRELWRSYPAFCAVGPAGIVVGDKSKQTCDEYSWSQVRKVDVNVRNQLVLKSPGGEVVLNSYSGREADRCADYISEILEYGYPPSW